MAIEWKPFLLGRLERLELVLSQLSEIEAERDAAVAAGPGLAFLALFSISQGIRELVGGTLDTMQGLMVLRENSPSPVFSDLPADMAKTLRGIPGVRCSSWRGRPA